MRPFRKGKLPRRARRGYRGDPVATVAFYGPDRRLATKIAVGIIPDEHSGPIALERWYSEDGADLRRSAAVAEEILRFIDAHGAKTVTMSDGTIGCPHEEGKDYAEGEACPRCPYWHHRDSWSVGAVSKS